MRRNTEPSFIAKLQQIGWRTKHDMAEELSLSYRYITVKFKEFALKAGYTGSWLKSKEIICTVKHPKIPRINSRVIRFLPPEIVREFKIYMKKI